MPLNNAPIDNALTDDNMVTMVWVKWLAALTRAVNTITLGAQSAPVVKDLTSVVWCASESGIKDGVAYSVGDLLVTISVAGTSKTKLLADYSAL